MIVLGASSLAAIGFSLALAASPAEPVGTFCLALAELGAEPTCAAHSGRTIRFPPAETERLGVWTARDFSRVAVFGIAPRQREVAIGVGEGPKAIHYRVTTRRLPRGARTISFSSIIKVSTL